MFANETLSALRLGLATQWAQPRHVLLIAAGFAIAALTLTTLLSIPAGLDRLGAATGRDDIALVLDATASDETSSTIAPDLAALVGTLAGIARDASGKPAVAAQFIAMAKLKRKDGSPASVLLRGIDAATWSMLGNSVHVDKGTTFKSGVDELIAGASAARAFVALDAGDQIKVRDSVWRVSGQFTAPGLWESELWTDIAPLEAAFNASGRISELWVRLESADAFDTFATALKTDKRLAGVRAERQRTHYGERTSFLSHFVRIAAIAIGATLGLGAVLAIANSLAMALAARRKQLAVLRAIGFRSRCLFVALAIEVLMIAVLVTVLVLLGARLGLHGMQVGSSTGDQSISFTLEVTSAVAQWTLAYAMILALASAWWPARRALHTQLVVALREE